VLYGLDAVYAIILLAIGWWLIDIANADRPVVELTVTANVKPSDTDAVKQEAMDRIGRLVAEVSRSPGPEGPGGAAPGMSRQAK
jgi:hypothetical protein